MNETCWPGRSAPSPYSTAYPGVTVATTSHASASSALDRDLGAELVGDVAAARLVHVPHERRSAVGDEHPGRLRAVHAGAHDRP